MFLFVTWFSQHVDKSKTQDLMKIIAKYKSWAGLTLKMKDRKYAIRGT